MGREASCTVRYRGKTSEGKALLETDVLLFRGAFRLAIPLATVRSVEAKSGQLTVTFPDGRAQFELGSQAERWAQAITTPKRLVDKLGIRRDSKVIVLGVAERRFWDELESVGAVVSIGRLRLNADVIILETKTKADLKRLAHLQEFLQSDGAIWVVAPKGTALLTERDILAAGKAARLVDTKVVRFSDTHAGHKFVIPLARR